VKAKSTDIFADLLYAAKKLSLLSDGLPPQEKTGNARTQ
jgi:hypothetical protein